jgi:membrane protease subunit (stomatin/prohibitin family)
MMEEEWSWEEERIKARIAAMLMGMGMGTDMGMDNADAVMQCQQEEDRMMQEPSSDKGGS